MFLRSAECLPRNFFVAKASYKPHSVCHTFKKCGTTVIYLGPASPRGSSGTPQTGLGSCKRHGLAPGGVYHSCMSPCGDPLKAELFTFVTLFLSKGRDSIVSVALSLGLGHARVFSRKTGAVRIPGWRYQPPSSQHLTYRGCADFPPYKDTTRSAISCRVTTRSSWPHEHNKIRKKIKPKKFM